MGISSGLVARRMSNSRKVPQNHPAETKVGADNNPTIQVAEISHNRSTDTIETLAGLSANSLYPRLALWLMDASEQDIASYWGSYQKGELNDDITLLIFLRWVRLNPQAAIAAAGTKKQFPAWRAWACHDPQASLAAAIATGDDDDQIDSVAYGIGEFHPAWLRRHFHEIPESAQPVATQGMAEWDDTENPLETLRFIEENDNYPEPGAIKALARQDPSSALDWANRSFARDYFDAPALVIETLANERPEDLKRIAGQMPSGDLRLEMEVALFKNLLKSDPAAALEQARSATIPSIAAARYAALGESVVQDDPEQAFQLAKDLFTACPDALFPGVKVEYPVYESVSGFKIPGIREFTNSLMATDPARFMDQVLLFPAGRDDFLRFDHLSSSWAERDLPAYTNWLNQQADRTARKRGAAVISTTLQQTGHFEEAADWALVNVSDNVRPMLELITTWKNADPGATEKWLESADLSDEQKAFVHTILAAPR